MTLEQIKYQNPSSYIKYLSYILFSYVLFIFFIALFGKGFGALESLGIVSLSCGLAIFYVMYKAQNIIFKRIDYLLVWIIFMIQSLIGIIHFQNIINPEYFSADVLGVDIDGGTVASQTLTILGRKAAIPNFYPKHAYEDTFVFVAKHCL